MLLFQALFVGVALAADPVRTRADEVPSGAELAAEERLDAARCNPALGLLFPGVAQACLGSPVEAGVLAGLAGAEVAATAALLARRGPEVLSVTGGQVPLVALQDLWVLSLADALRVRQLAARRPYAPTEDLAGLALAPFQPVALKRPLVWAGVPVLVAGGVGLSALLGDLEPTGGQPNVWGTRRSEPAGAALFAVSGVAFFEHVAVTEELVFRGLIQDGFTRASGRPVVGWAVGSAVFGLTHAANVVALPAEARLGYLFVAVPYITLVGAVIGAEHVWNDHRLTSPVAMHFWYDLLLSAAGYALSPDDNLFSLTLSGPLARR